MEGNTKILVALDDGDAVALEPDVGQEGVLGCGADKHDATLVNICLQAIAAEPSVKAEHGILHSFGRITDDSGIISKEKDSHGAVKRKARHRHTGGFVDGCDEIVDEDVEEKRAEGAALADASFHWERSAGRTRGRRNLGHGVEVERR